ncbi:L-aspartate oxidase [Amaricoccus macauensis]|uniref:L-aspartate oxidase n=1 Tax=Amaricoccus macauensis TaxID=57001 RepID=UPI003C7DE34D
MPRIETGRIVIVGAGLGALYAALKLAPRPVVVISPETLGAGASSAWAQGGVAAAMDRADTAESHAKDTEIAGAGIVDHAVALRVTEVARQHILDLTKLGAPFDRTKEGGYVLSREAAHSFARVVRVRGDQAGREIMQALISEVRTTPSIQVLEGAMAIGLETAEGRTTGLRIMSSGPVGSAPVILSGPAILLAGGGSGGLYSVTTNPPRIRGQVIGMAARAGAVIADAEFVQFHPTAIDTGEDPAPLATEALRGEGAVLINKHGERFMRAIHPDAELAPRDIVARAIYAQRQAGLRPMLDTRAALGSRILAEFPAVTESCIRAGLDPVHGAIPVAAAAHYHMGGVEVGSEGRSNLAGLWVCGEASSTGLHGANRLASNGLLEALAYADFCARDIAASCPPAGSEAEIAPGFQGTGNQPDPDAVAALRKIMTDHVGVVRNVDGLTTALTGIARLEAEYGPDCPTFLNMTATATLIAAAALKREESRGGHFREDFPDPRPELANRSRLTYAEARDLRERLARETT